MKHIVRLLLLPLGMIVLALFVSCSLFDTSTAIEADGDVIPDSLLIDDSTVLSSDNIELTLVITQPFDRCTRLDLRLRVDSAYEHYDFSDVHADVAFGGHIISIDSLRRSSSGRNYSRTVVDSYELVEGDVCRIVLVCPHVGAFNKVVIVPSPPKLHSVSPVIYNDSSALKVLYSSNNESKTTFDSWMYTNFEKDSTTIHEYNYGGKKDISDTTFIFYLLKEYKMPGFNYAGYSIHSRAYNRCEIEELGKRSYITCFSKYSDSLSGI